MNKIDGIKSYNQVILAIGGTLVVLFILVLGIFILSDEWDRRNRNTDYQEGILATQATDNLLKDSLRKQIISLNSIELLDSASKIYLIPVRQANLKDGESVDELLGLVNSFSGGSRYSKYHGETAFNNLILYNSLGEKSEILFDKRISISSYQIIKKENDKYLVILGTSKDSNQDQYLNSEDLQDLFIYDVRKEELTQIPAEEKFTTLNILIQNKTDEVMGKFGLDRNDNGEFEVGKEPMTIYKIDLPSKTLVKILKAEQIEKLQELLEGR